MPQYDIAMLLTVDIGLALFGIAATVIAAWAIMQQNIRFSRELTQNTREIAEMHREVAFMIRRQYGDIDRDLQEIKELLGGQ